MKDASRRWRPPMTPDAVVFDFDGVIANSEPLHFGVYQRLLAEEGLTFTSDEYYSRYLGYRRRRRVRSAGARQGPRRSATTGWRRCIDRKTALFQSIVRSTPVLYRRRARTACSPWRRVPHRHRLGRAPARDRDDSGRRRARGRRAGDRRGRRDTARQAGARSVRAGRRAAVGAAGPAARSPARSVGIEDSHWGLQSARAAGLRTIGADDQLSGQPASRPT